MKAFLDTNIVIDFYDQRGDFYYPAAVIFDLAHKGKIQHIQPATGLRRDSCGCTQPWLQ